MRGQAALPLRISEKITRFPASGFRVQVLKKEMFGGLVGCHQPQDESLNLQGRGSDGLGKKSSGAKGHPGSGCGWELTPSSAQWPLFAEAPKK